MRVVDKEAYFKAIGYQPHSLGQRSFHSSNARFRVPVCGRRYGKSTMAGKDVQPELLVQGRRYWIVGPTYDLGEKEFRVIWDDLIVRRGLGKDKRLKKAYNKKQGDMFIEFPWQTRIEVRSAEHPASLVGEALDGVIMSEAAKHKFETWDRYIRPALSDKRGWATFPTTPEGFNWLYNMWQFGQDPSLPEYESWQFPSWDNRAVFPGGRTDPEIQLIERTTTPEWFLQEYGADFASFVGKIYGEFTELTHVKDFTFNPLWENYISFDWGFTHPLAAIEFQVDPWDNVWIWREHVKSYWRLQEHLDFMKAREQPKDYFITMCFGDAADPGAAQTVSENLAPCWALPEAKENWREGVEVVKRYLKLYKTGELDEYGTPKTEPKLFVARNCVQTIREFNNYKAADTSRRAAPPREANSAGAALRQEDNAMDAIRYGLMHRFELGVKHHLSEVVTSEELTRSPLVPSGDAGYSTMGMRW